MDGNNSIKNTIAISIKAMGNEPLIMSEKVKSFGNTPFATNRAKPNGGVKLDASMHTNKIKPNTTGLKPKKWIKGINKGNTIINIELGSKKQPKIITITIMRAIMPVSDMGNAATIAISSLVAPVYAII